MADLDQTRDDPHKQFWEQIESVTAGMLGVENSRQHAQPMAPHIDRETGRIWFFTKKTTDLVRDVGQGARAQFIIVGRDHDYHACASGTLTQNKDEAKIEEFWNPVIAAWFESGKNDPDLMLLEFVLQNATIWAGTSSSLTFGWEIAKANLTEGEPNVGIQKHIKFNSGTSHKAA